MIVFKDECVEANFTTEPILFEIIYRDIVCFYYTSEQSKCLFYLFVVQTEPGIYSASKKTCYQLNTN